ncbi:MAG TPA: hypothetical protein VIW25_04885 [Nitrososphaeraceae archaeon]|jgi:hypothetical protein
MQKHRPPLILVILALGFTLVSFTIFTGAPIQIISKVLATNTTADSVRSTNGSSITLGSPQTYTQYYHNFWAGFKPIIVNGTHEFVESSTSNRILNGTFVPHHYKVFLINGTNGTSHIVGYGSHSNGDTHFFRSIGHMGADGTMRVIGSSITSKGMVGIGKGVIYKNGTGIIKEWYWK